MTSFAFCGPLGAVDTQLQLIFLGRVHLASCCLGYDSESGISPPVCSLYRCISKSILTAVTNNCRISMPDMAKLFSWSHCSPIRYIYIYTHTHIYIYIYILWPDLWHMQVPGLGVESELELQLLAYTTATATPDLSHICDLRHSSRQCGSLTHWARLGIELDLHSLRYKSAW